VTLFLFLTTIDGFASARASSTLRSSSVCSNWLLIVFVWDRPEQADASVVQLLNRPRVLLHVLQDNDMQEIFSQIGGTNFHHVLVVQAFQGGRVLCRLLHRRFPRPSSIKQNRWKNVCGKLKGGGVCGKQQGLTNETYVMYSLPEKLYLLLGHSTNLQIKPLFKTGGKTTMYGVHSSSKKMMGNDPE
jgi:hypothetical protein